MKYILTFLVAATAVCLADGPPNQTNAGELPQLRKERREHRDTSGAVDAFTDLFYRGQERILIQTTYTAPKPSGIRMWREFIVGRNAVMKEMDYGDGKPRLIWVYRDGALCEAFRRQPDGSVEPMSSGELAKVKRDTQELMAGFEAVMEQVSDHVQTNSVEKVMRDLKVELEQKKQQQQDGREKK